MTHWAKVDVGWLGVTERGDVFLVCEGGALGFELRRLNIVRPRWADGGLVLGSCFVGTAVTAEQCMAQAEALVWAVP